MNAINNIELAMIARETPTCKCTLDHGVSAEKNWHFASKTVAVRSRQKSLFEG